MSDYSDDNSLDYDNSINDSDNSSISETELKKNIHYLKKKLKQKKSQKIYINWCESINLHETEKIWNLSKSSKEYIINKYDDFKIWYKIFKTKLTFLEDFYDYNKIKTKQFLLSKYGNKLFKNINISQNKFFVGEYLGLRNKCPFQNFNS